MCIGAQHEEPKLCTQWSVQVCNNADIPGSAGCGSTYVNSRQRTSTYVNWFLGWRIGQPVDGEVKVRCLLQVAKGKRRSKGPLCKSLLQKLLHSRSRMTPPVVTTSAPPANVPSVMSLVSPSIVVQSGQRRRKRSNVLSLPLEEEQRRLQLWRRWCWWRH